MKIYLTTDTHFYHDLMIEYCNRPKDFTELVGMNLLKVGLTKDDLLIHLGDVCIGNDQLAHDLYIKPFRCKKWLLKGNHDHKSNHWYLQNGWDFVGDQFSAKFFGKIILFSHIPVAWDGYYDTNIHGHFHNSDYRRHEPELMAIKNGYQKLLALEYTDYKPVLLENFLSTPNTKVEVDQCPKCGRWGVGQKCKDHIYFINPKKEEVG